MKISPPLPWAVVSSCLLLAGAPMASAQITSFIGTQHFNDGDVIGTGTYLTAVSLQPAPFNAFIGSDPSGPDFSAAWSMIYAAPDSVGSADLTIGIFDHDSKGSANPVSSFSLNGVDLTGALNTAMTAHGGANQEYNVYTLSLPISTYVALKTGTADFQLNLIGPGHSVLADTLFNGAGLDFARLNVYLAVPEPATEAWFGVAAGLALVGVRFARRAR